MHSVDKNYMYQQVLGVMMDGGWDEITLGEV